MKRQSDVGINVVCDGEFGRPSWNSYLHGRLSGHEVISLAADSGQHPASRDRTEFSDYYDELARTGATSYRSPGGEIPKGMPVGMHGPCIVYWPGCTAAGFG